MSLHPPYTFDQVRSASIEYFGGDELAGDVFTKKYALQDLKKQFWELTPADSHVRIAKELHRIEQKYPNPLSYEEILRMLSSWEFMVQGSPFSGIGNPFQIQSISNCFVVDGPKDSYGGIFMTDQEQVQIMKRRGGVGHDISNIRPKGLPAANAARTTDGIAVFMERFSNSTREVAQGGRRGALMMTISVHHPEILTFINIKRDKTKVTGANISVKCSDEFMHAVREGKQYQLRFPVEKDVPHIVEEMVDARGIWTELMAAAHESAEPGVLFWDTIIRESPADCYADVGYETKSTNPCGELPLCPYDSCRLAVVNLTKFVVNAFKEPHFDFMRFGVIVRRAQRLMDDIIDLELEMIDKIIEKISADPEPHAVKQIELELWLKIKAATSGGRRTGLGVTGVGDALAMLNVKYGSELSLHWVEAIYEQHAISSYESSIQMAAERGNFPVFSLEKEKDNPFLKRILGRIDVDYELLYRNFGRRNIANTTTAPVGSLSTLFQTSSGIEPAVFLDYKRRRKINPDDQGAKIDFVDQSGDSWQEYEVYHHGVQWWMDATGEKDVTKSPYHGATAEEIDWTKKVELQAAAQRWIDHSISNTTNLPNDATVQDVSAVYMKGWETGCKGVTVYRAGSRSGVLISSESETGDGPRGNTIRDTMAPRRPLVLPCHLHRASVKGEQYLIVVGLLGDRPYEVFAGLAENFDVGKKETKGTVIKVPRKSGARYRLVVDDILIDDIMETFDNPNHGAFTRTLSTALRHGVPVQYLVEQLRKDKHSDFTSFSTVVARVLKGYIPDGTKSSEKSCPSCEQENLVYKEGCVSCMNCGFSKCG